jgi:hypothetical protein
LLLLMMVVWSVSLRSRAVFFVCFDVDAVEWNASSCAGMGFFPGLSGGAVLLMVAWG